VVGVLGYRSGGPGSIPGTTRKKKCFMKDSKTKLGKLFEMKCRLKRYSGLKLNEVCLMSYEVTKLIFFEYDPETGRQIEGWHTPRYLRNKKALMSMSKTKRVVTFCLYSGWAVPSATCVMAMNVTYC
jgi:hypothetical protein